MIEEPLAGMTLTRYITKAMTYPSLTPEEEFDLSVKKLEGDIDAAYRLTLSHMKLVVSMAKRYASYGLSEDDLIQEGTIGLMHAVKKYDPHKNSRLSSYAMTWIKNHILEYVIANWRLVHNITTKGKRKLFFNLRSMQSEYGKLLPAERQRAIDELSVSNSDIDEMLQTFAGDISFDLNVGDEDGEVSMYNFLAQDNSDPSVLLEELEHETLALKLEDAISQLPEREQIIIRGRFLDEKKITLTELAQQVGVSTERVRQLEGKILAKLKDMLVNSTLKPKH